MRITNFSSLVSFSVAAPGARLVGGANVDHSVLLMAWTHGTPLPMCPDFLGYVGSPWKLSLDQSLAPGVYQYGPVCGGLANLTVTADIELVYAY